MRLNIWVTLAVGVFATAAFAHSGVKDPDVKARMALMTEVKEATGVLGDMARGKMAFDAAQAEVARAALEAHATRIPTAFETQAQDPKSEALPVIWSDWQGFVAAAEQMETAASGMKVASLDDLRGGMGALGKSCASCHETYRIDK
ncbi:cytochrome c [Aestuariicoccus sp. MJ-SS9]|uniref:c-type cytochrome n=1 Tax=Aestuariicoccus sp. MJ-SS9 TaxID=3079855 RepID=UPI00290B717E|nr:cytochrome c [Aestuariicoccus sp. MJ-SS9]MDU8910762.1 cytochrome c [Aestuariicoccus sp. MJ-SS9]